MTFIGAIVLIGLTNTFTSTVTSDSRISAEVSTQVGVATGSGLSFVSSTQVEHAAQQAGLDKATTAAGWSTTMRQPSCDHSKPASWVPPS